MPQVNLPPENWFFQQLQNAKNQLLQLETQQYGLRVVSDTAPGPLTTSSSTLSFLTGSPEFEAVVGSSGNGIVTVSATVAWSGSSGGCYVFTVIDGDLNTTWSTVFASTVNGGGPFVMTLSGSVTLYEMFSGIGVSPGIHLFQPWVQTAAGYSGTATLTNFSMIFQPL